MYPVLFLRIADCEVLTHSAIKDVIERLEQNSDPALLEGFKPALQSHLAEYLRRGARYYPGGSRFLDFCKAAAGYGLIEGVYGVFEFTYAYIPPEQKLWYLEDSVEFPFPAVAALPFLDDACRGAGVGF